jgi:hypothetical protein
MKYPFRAGCGLGGHVWFVVARSGNPLSALLRVRFVQTAQASGLRLEIFLVFTSSENVSSENHSFHRIVTDDGYIFNLRGAQARVIRGYLPFSF